MLRKLAVVVVITATLCWATTASAAPIAPYHGENPFQCQTQNTGFGVDYPDPGADPFCVKYNKTNQNVRHVGLVDFLLLEPARVAAAVPKCFYHQHDQWTGWVTHGGQELWNWRGRYFFDKARGMGGVFVTDVRVLGQPYDPRLLPGFPPELRAVLRTRRGWRLHRHGRRGADLRREGRHSRRGGAGLPARLAIPRLAE